MSIIKVTVDDQALYVTESPVVAAQGVNENYFQFTLSSDWAGFGVVALFWKEGNETDVYESVVDGTGKALVPHEVTDLQGRFCVGLAGTKGDIIHTSEVLKYKVVKGRYTAGQGSEPPTPGIYEQMLALAGEMREAFSEAVTVQGAVIEQIRTEQATLRSELTTEQETFEDRITGQVDTFIGDHGGTYGQTTLWTSPDTNGIIGKDTTVTLSESVESYDYVDIYSFNGDKNEIATIPVDSVLTQGEGYAIRTVNVSTSTVKMNVVESRLTIAGTVFTIVNEYIYQAGQSNPVHQITQDNKSSYVGAFGITKVVGRKLVENAEVADIRVGADGTVYQTAGAAVRGQFAEVKAQIPLVDASLATAGKAADAKATGDAIANVNGRLQLQGLPECDIPNVYRTTRNLANPIYVSPRTVNGITYGTDESGKVTITGTATAQVDVPIYNAETIELPADRYLLTFVGDWSASKAVTGYIRGDNAYPMNVITSGRRFAFRVYSGVYRGHMLRIPTGTTMNVNAYVKFESGTHETEYIPHWAVADIELRQKYDNPTVKFKMLNTHYIGDCCIFKDPSGKVLVIDCGGYTNTIAMNALEQALTDMQIYSVDYLIISHYHVDHVSGIQKFNQKGVLTSATKIYAPGGFAEHAQDITELEGNDRALENYNLLMNTANSLGCTVINPSDGDTFTMGEIKVEFFNCDHSDYYSNLSYEEGGAVYNDCSICNYVTIGDTVMMFTGDIESAAMKKLEKSVRKCNIFKVPHHCGRGAYNRMFMNSCYPDIAITSLGDGYTFNCTTEANRQVFIANNTGLQKWFEDIGDVPNYIVGIMMTDIDMDLSRYGWKFTNNVRRCIRADEGLV